MPKILLIAIIGCLTAFTGFSGGAAFSLFAHRLGKHAVGVFMGFTAGLLIAFICFEMLPISFENWGLYYSIAGIAAGSVFSSLLEERVKPGALLGIGIALHNLPEGMALGSMLNYSLIQGMSMAVIIAVHCLPEALAFAIPLREDGASYRRVILYTVAMSVPMGLGAMTGGVLSSMLPGFVYMCLSFAGGVMLYITCGEIIPESKARGRLSTIGAIAGFAAGVLLTAKL